MKTELPVVPSDLEVHDNTKLSDYARCPFLYWIRHVRGLSPRRASQALGFGGLVHDGLAEYYVKLTEGESALDAAAAAIETMQEAEYEDPVDGHRTRERAIMTLAQYAEKYGEDDDFREILFTETPFNIVDDHGLPYGGRIDLIARGFGNRVWVVDHKTSSYFGNTYFDGFRSSPQMVGYTWAGGQMHGQPIAGVVVNNLTIRKSGSTEFHRMPIRYPEWMLDEWYEDTVRRLQEIHRAIEDEYYERRRWNCKNKYGKCPAWNVCHGLPQNTERLIDLDFIEQKWDWNDPDGKSS